MDCYIGTILPWAVDYAPQDWVLCQGQLLQVAQYQALFSLLGTKYGGDGKNTFGVPNLQGRGMVGAGISPAGTSRVNGSTGGAESVALKPSNMPPAQPHTHTLMGNSNGSLPVTNTPASSSVLGIPTDSMKKAINTYTNISGITPTPTLTAMSSQSIGPATVSGAISEAFSIMQPFQVVNFIICVNGLYPTRP